MTRHNHLAIAATVLLLQGFGWLWYSPLLFLSPWVHGLGKEVGQLNSSAPLPYVASVLGTIMLCYVLSWCVRALQLETFRQGMGLGAVLACGLSAPALLTHYAFIGTSWTVGAIDALQSVVATAIAAGILTIWRPAASGPDAQD